MTTPNTRSTGTRGASNQWVREALKQDGRSYSEIATEMTRKNLGMTYTKSTIYKMANDRKVTKEEA